MDQISLILHQISLKDKKNGKLNELLDTRSNVDVKELGKLNTRLNRKVMKKWLENLKKTSNTPKTSLPITGIARRSQKEINNY